MNQSSTFCCQKRRKIAIDLVYKGKSLKFSVPKDQPSNINWHNLVYNPKQRCCRKAMSIITCCFIILIVLIIVLIFDRFEEKVGEKYNMNINCEYFEDDSSYSHIIHEFDTNVPYTQRTYTYCYCENALSLSQFIDVYIKKKPLPGRDDIIPCKEYFLIYLKYLSISKGIAFIIPLLNILIDLLLGCLTSFEKNTTLSKEMSSNMCKVFFIEFIDSCVLLILINTKIGKNIPILSGTFDDFSYGWYRKVGIVLIYSMIINIFMPHLGTIVSLIMKSCCRCCDRGCSCKGIKTKKKLRKKYFKLYVGPEFDIDSRYATTLSYFYIVMVLGSGMPILYILFSLYLLLSFIIDKTLTIKYYKTPPKYGLNINNTFISFSFGGIALHFLIAIWIFGNPSFMSGKLMTDK